MSAARLNLFQRAILHWRTLHPYCAAHVVASPRPLDRERLRASIAGVLEDCGLTGFTLDAQRSRYAFAGGPAHVDLAVLEASKDAFDVAGDEIRTSINRAFPSDGAFDPFRFFAVPDGTGCLVGIVYDHIVAAGDSIALLMTDIAARYAADDPAGVPLSPLALPDATCRHLLLRHPFKLLRGLVALPALVRGWRSVVRPEFADLADGRNGFVHFGIDEGAYGRLRARAKRLGITTNDLLLAAVMAAVAPLAGHRDPARRRHAIAIASIINLRSEFQAPVTAVFGPFLASFRVVHPFPEDADLDDVARDIGRQTAWARRDRLYYLTLIAMGLAGVIWRRASLPKRQRLYPKYHPVLAGITPVNVDALRRHGSARPGDYLRAASTGPMSPLVVAFTTSGAALRVGITYRTTAIPDDRARAVARSLRQSIDPG
jgi:hypothetical protein